MKRNLKKWVVYLITTINIIIYMGAGSENNTILTDLIIIIIFVLNSAILLKYDHKYLITGDMIENEE